VSAKRVLDRGEAAAAVRAAREGGHRVSFTNGCFDLLHVGHVRLLEAARAAGDRLLVGVNDDDSVRRLKGEGRPLVAIGERLEILAALRAVSWVVPFSEDTPLELIRSVRPDVLVKGADYTEHEIVGAAEVRGWGGAIVRVPLVPDRSTTRLLGRMDSGDSGPGQGLDSPGGR
jgi:D-beta-D-heptose 7-phosphate kinase/D-beta-D-heptose 1-phosphate adenosyltransferase